MMRDFRKITELALSASGLVAKRSLLDWDVRENEQANSFDIIASAHCALDEHFFARTSVAHKEISAVTSLNGFESLLGERVRHCADSVWSLVVDEPRWFALGRLLGAV